MNPGDSGLSEMVPARAPRWKTEAQGQAPGEDDRADCGGGGGGAGRRAVPVLRGMRREVQVKDSEVLQ